MITQILAHQVECSCILLLFGLSVNLFLLGVNILFPFSEGVLRFLKLHLKIYSGQPEFWTRQLKKTKSSSTPVPT